jgi:hypothetical protein
MNSLGQRPHPHGAGLLRIKTNARTSGRYGVVDNHPTAGAVDTSAVGLITDTPQNFPVVRGSIAKTLPL